MLLYTGTFVTADSRRRYGSVMRNITDFVLLLCQDHKG